MRRITGYTAVAVITLTIACTPSMGGLWFLAPVFLVIHHEHRIQHQVRTLINGIRTYSDNRD